MGERPVSRSGGTTEYSAGSITWRSEVRPSPAGGDRSRLYSARDRSDWWHWGAMVVALGLAPLAGALGLSTMLASPTPFVASLGPTAPDRTSMSAGGAITAPIYVPAADRV